MGGPQNENYSTLAVGGRVPGKTGKWRLWLVGCGGGGSLGGVVPESVIPRFSVRNRGSHGKSLVKITRCGCAVAVAVGGESLGTSEI